MTKKTKIVATKKLTSTKIWASKDDKQQSQKMFKASDVFSLEDLKFWKIHVMHVTQHVNIAELSEWYTGGT